MDNTMTGIFLDSCPKCGNNQTALVGYFSHCKKCGADWLSIRNVEVQPVIGWHHWWVQSCDEGTIYNDFIASSPEVKE